MSTLVIKVGPSVDNLQICNPNDEDRPVHVVSENFEGYVLIRVNNFHGVVPPGHRRIPTTEYFEGHRRKMSFQFQGKFNKAYTADDLGKEKHINNDWDKPLNVPKLMGLFTKVRFLVLVAKLIFPKFWSMTDPGSYNDLKIATPYMRSYVITAMCSIMAWPNRRPSDETFRPMIVESINFLLPPDPAESQPSSPRQTAATINASISALSLNTTTGSAPPARGTSLGTASPNVPGTPAEPAQGSKMSFTPRGSSLAPTPDPNGKDSKALLKMRCGGEEAVKERRKYFSNEENRRSVLFQPGFVYGFEVFNPYFDPNTFKIKIPGLTIDMLKVTNGQPMRTRLMTKDGSTVFFVVEVSVSGAADEDAEGDIPA
ncbi:hypothetical protein HDU96_004647 [Phlyctochytrium bullatum]|nr:hypothetical protein HDU96_004647 [Phlyctochytrium bullatum]